MSNQQHVIEDPSQLNALSVLLSQSFIRSKQLGTIILGGNIAGHAQRTEWERELNHNYYACGCHQGAMGLIIGLSLGAAWPLFRYSQGTWPASTAAWVVSISLGVVAAVLGKLVGLSRARRRLQQTIREIQKELP